MLLFQLFGIYLIFLEARKLQDHEDQHGGLNSNDVFIAHSPFQIAHVTKTFDKLSLAAVCLEIACSSGSLEE